MTVTSISDTPIKLCWKKLDRKTKKVDFQVKRNMAHSEDEARTDTLESLIIDLKLVEDELESIFWKI